MKVGPDSAGFKPRPACCGLGGTEGGGAGHPGSVRINGVEVDARMPQYLVQGNTVTLTTPGGGYGDPAARDPLLTTRDAVLGYDPPA